MLALIVAAALAQGATGGVVVDEANVDWLARPTHRDFELFFPDRAARLNLSGRAIIECQVTATGTLSKCRAIEESPPGAGFAEAAVAISRLFKMKAVAKDGTPVAGATVRMPIAFSPQSRTSSGVQLPAPLPAPDGARPVRAVDLAVRQRFSGTPGPEDFARLYPFEAGMRGFASVVTLTCTPTATGDLRDCEAAAEGPYANEFRGAARDLAKFFRLKDPPTDGARISFPVRFSVPATELPKVRVVQPGATEGVVRINCRIAADGAFDNCLVYDDEEHRPDLYDAALKVAAKIAAPKGLATNARVVVPLHVVPPSTAAR